VTALLRDDVAELAPLVRRAVDLDASGLARVRRRDGRMSALVRLPFGVLAARTVAVTSDAPDLDTTVRGTDLLAWLDGECAALPPARDEDWRGGTPPAAGWRRIETVPDATVRAVVRRGAQTLQQAAAREGVPGAQPRQAVADALLDSVVLIVSDDAQSVGLTLRTLSALTRMGFLARDSHAGVDVTGRWIRVAGAYGSVYAERPGLGLALR
jgi:hypothetical protein